VIRNSSLDNDVAGNRLSGKPRQRLDAEIAAESDVHARIAQRSFAEVERGFDRISSAFGRMTSRATRE
jgi:hypothetical protein